MSQTYTFPIPPGASAVDLLARAKDAGRARGIALSGDGSKGAFKGTAEGTYEVAAGEIRVTVEKKPGFVPWGIVESSLKGLFAPK